MANPASIPERHTVGYRELVKTHDGMSQVESHDDPVDKPVFGWAPPAPDDIVRSEQTGMKHVLDVYCAVPFTKHRDLLVVNGVEYTVQGAPDDYRFGPFGFTPGVRVRLMRAEG